MSMDSMKDKEERAARSCPIDVAVRPIVDAVAVVVIAMFPSMPSRRELDLRALVLSPG